MRVSRNAIGALVLFIAGACLPGESTSQTAVTPADSAGAVAADTARTARTTPAKAKRARRVFFGGGVSFTFGTLTRVSVSPLIGYQLSKVFSVGTQVSYDYMRQEVQGDDFTVRSFGGSAFGRAHVNQFYAHVEPAVFDQEVVSADESRRRDTVPYLFVGGGVFYPLAPGLRAFVQVTFDVLRDPDSPYRRGESFVTTGITVGP